MLGPVQEGNKLEESIDPSPLRPTLRQAQGERGGGPVGVVLAAGRGVRMISALPKVLHPVSGTPMISRVISSLERAGCLEIVVVLPPDDQVVRAALSPGTRVVHQPRPLGTGDAVRAALEAIEATEGPLLVVGGDTPLVTPKTLRAAAEEVGAAPIAMAVAEVADPHGYGRVIVSADGRVSRIVEEADATSEERANCLVNGMVFAFDMAWLRTWLPSVGPAANGEIYLTALIELAAGQNRAAAALRCDSSEVIGVNTRRDLARAEFALRERVNNGLMDLGVTLIDPASTYVAESVIVAPDVTIFPNSYLRGQTVIEAGCVIGPGAEVVDSWLGAGVRVCWSVLEGAQVAPGVRIGPYCRIRPGTVLSEGVILGSFAEVKNSTLGSRTQVHHFSYLGDAILGSDVNVGAGTITCNFDGKDKHVTTIEDGAFIGSDTLLIAPVRVGANAVTGAGSVVTRDVEENTVVVGVPARRLRGAGPSGAGDTELPTEAVSEEAGGHGI